MLLPCTLLICPPQTHVINDGKYGVQAPTNFYAMTAFGEGLSDDDIFAIIDYMSLWWTDEQRAWQEQL
ncbi:MAG: hypothetical protein AAFQ07_18495, partial [Chloroflexota bacterium]